MENTFTYIPVILLEKSSHQSNDRGWDSGEVAKPFSWTFSPAFLLLLFSPLMGPIQTEKPRRIKAWEESKAPTTTRIEHTKVTGVAEEESGFLLFGCPSEHATRFSNNERWREDSSFGAMAMGFLFIYTMQPSRVDAE